MPLSIVLKVLQVFKRISTYTLYVSFEKERVEKYEMK